MPNTETASALTSMMAIQGSRLMGIPGFQESPWAGSHAASGRFNAGFSIFLVCSAYEDESPNSILLMFSSKIEFN
jgi:hypothetical protein